MSTTWNPWHGCEKISAGCTHCYVYRIDSKHGRDSSVVAKTLSYNLPVKRKRNGDYKIPSGEHIYACFSSDFFLDTADPWRPEAWRMIRERQDCHFTIITKRIHRFYVGLPDDWGEGYAHVSIGVTVENQDRADYRLPLFMAAPIKHKMIICEPLLGFIDLEKYLGPWAALVLAGGESGNEARICNYDWVLSLQQQCKARGIPFHFKQTGARFQKGNRIYKINRKYQAAQARKAGIDLNNGFE